MAGGPHVGGGALREITVVLAVALVGLLIAAVAAFTPWYEREAGAAVVEMRAPGVAPR